MNLAKKEPLRLLPPRRVSQHFLRIDHTSKLLQRLSASVPPAAAGSHCPGLRLKQLRFEEPGSTAYWCARYRLRRGSTCSNCVASAVGSALRMSSQGACCGSSSSVTGSFLPGPCAQWPLGISTAVQKHGAHYLHCPRRHAADVHCSICRCAWFNLQRQIKIINWAKLFSPNPGS